MMIFDLQVLEMVDSVLKEHGAHAPKARLALETAKPAVKVGPIVAKAPRMANLSLTAAQKLFQGQQG